MHIYNKSCKVEFLTKDLIEFDYVNWLGRKDHRIVETQQIYFGNTMFHPIPQWLLVGIDIEKEQERTFAMKDMVNVRHY
jgi:hypothetical protein